MASAKKIANIYAELSVRDKMSMGLKRASAAAKRFGGMAIKAGAAGGVALAGGLAYGTKKTIAAGAELDHLSSQTGLAVSSILRIRQAYKDAGKSADGLGKDVGKMQRAIFDAAAAPGTTIDYFKDLGLSAGALMEMSPEEQFFVIGEALKGVKNQTKQAALALQIFGRSGGQLLTVFKGSNMEDVNKSLGRMPEIMQEFSGALERADTLMGRLPNKSQQFFTGFTAGVVGQLLPGLEKADTYDFTTLGENLGNNVAFGMEGLTDGGLFEVAVLKGMAAFTRMGDSLASALKAGMEAATDSVEMQKLGAFLEGGLTEIFGNDQMKRAYQDKVMAWHEAQSVSPSQKFAESFDKHFKNNQLSSGISEELERQADAIWSNIGKRAKANRIAASQIGSETRIEDKPIDVMEGLKNAQIGTAKEASKSWESLKADVNSMQARGLGMGAIHVPNEVKKQVTLLEQIRDAIKKAGEKEPVAVF